MFFAIFRRKLIAQCRSSVRYGLKSRLSVGVVRRVVRPLIVTFCSRHLCTACPETSESGICLRFPRPAKPASTASQQRCTLQTQREEEILLLTGSKITDTI